MNMKNHTKIRRGMSPKIEGENMKIMKIKDSKLKGGKTPLKDENFEKGWGEEMDAILEKNKNKR
jgi:hypothetical protein